MNEILVYGEIGVNITDVGFLEELANFKGQDIDVRINCPGGDVFQGYAMYNALKKHTGNVSIYIEGVAASFASVLCLAGSKVYAAENAMIMIHNPSLTADGDSRQLRKQADLLDKVKTVVLESYLQKLNVDETELSKMLDDETWFTANEALEIGFVNEITGAVLEKKPEPNEKTPVAIFACYKVKKGKENLTHKIDKKDIPAIVNVLGISKNSTPTQILDSIQNLKQKNVSLEKQFTDLKVKIKLSQKTESEQLTNQAIKLGIIPNGYRRIQLMAFSGDFDKTKSEIQLLINEKNLSVEMNLKQGVVREIVLGNYNNKNRSSGSKNSKKDDDEKPKSEWDLNDYRKFAPSELENDPELYAKLLETKYKKN